MKKILLTLLALGLVAGAAYGLTVAEAGQKVSAAAAWTAAKAKAMAQAAKNAAIRFQEYASSKATQLANYVKNSRLGQAASNAASRAGQFASRQATAFEKYVNESHLGQSISSASKKISAKLSTLQASASQSLKNFKDRLSDIKANMGATLDKFSDKAKSALSSAKKGLTKAGQSIKSGALKTADKASALAESIAASEAYKTLKEGAKAVGGFVLETSAPIIIGAIQQKINDAIIGGTQQALQAVGLQPNDVPNAQQQVVIDESVQEATAAVEQDFITRLTALNVDKSITDLLFEPIASGELTKDDAVKFLNQFNALVFYYLPEGKDTSFEELSSEDQKNLRQMAAILLGAVSTHVMSGADLIAVMDGMISAVVSAEQKILSTGLVEIASEVLNAGEEGDTSIQDTTQSPETSTAEDAPTPAEEAEADVEASFAALGA